jgi:hypothetical protein
MPHLLHIQIQKSQHTYKRVIHFSLISKGFQNGSSNPHTTTPRLNKIFVAQPTKSSAYLSLKLEKIILLSMGTPNAAVGIPLRHSWGW